MGSKLSTAVALEPPAAARRHDADDDLISALPDDLLHAILVRLSSAAAAARTSVLSRRWRGVWAHMPELVLRGDDAARPAPATPPPPPTNPSALLDTIDAALDSYAAPTLRSLDIFVRGSGAGSCDAVRAGRIAPWLRFASQRLAGSLRIGISLFVDDAVAQRSRDVEIGDELAVALPVCESATEIVLDFRINVFAKRFVLRPPQTGSFSALTDLSIICRQMDGGELGRLVSSPRCPRLRKLVVSVSELVPVPDVSVRSESLECLGYNASGTAKLEVTAPMLREISLLDPAEACTVVAPRLDKIDWHGAYDPGRHQLAVASRHLQLLSICWHWSSVGEIRNSSTRLMARFDAARELAVSVALFDEEWPQDMSGYVTFLKEMDKLPVCESLVIELESEDNHGLLPKMLYLLRRCSCIRKLKLLLCRHTPSKISSCTILSCPCRLPESYRSDDITLDSLEEIAISFFTGSAEQQEFIEVLLSRCNTVTLKTLDITVLSTPVSSEIMEFVERIRTMYSKVQVNVLTRDGEVPKPLAS